MAYGKRHCYAVKIEELEAEIDNYKATCMADDIIIEQQRAEIEEINALKNRLDNGIRYDEKLNVYIVVWTERELEIAQKDAAKLYAKLNWAPPEDETDEFGPVLLEDETLVIQEF